MSLLSGKKVLIGVTGGIAAYKSALLVRQFIKYGAEVKVVMTPSAKDFVTPLTLSTLSKNEVFSSFYNEEDENAQWNNHVDLGLWADLMVIAPATANTLSKMASGTSDNLLLATYLSAKCPVYFAPAMDLDMYKHPSSLQSFKTLQSFGNIMIPAGSGELASGLHGEGRMAEPEEIAAFIEQHLKASAPLLHKKVIITAGPTYEAIDPVRFIGNHSSGKMGYELAKQAAKQGANVILVSGPSSLTIVDDSVTLIRVNTAQQMYDEVHKHYDSVDVGIAAAAVSDYRPKVVADQKIKKAGEEMTIVLEKSPDILLSMGQQKNNQLLVGFALETENEIANAKKKLEKKNLDFIVLNSLNDKGAGFKKDTNKITIIDKAHNAKSFDLKSKAEVAKDIINEVIAKLNA
ncbi:bifunctional phosphopantothenoylcysteine decarboxylase/phosphopantothenate--cysteine ligase CoaBC [Croceibacter atlanticus]|jgi:phosphopantothenoylcysteine decarboxylase/phosphopantothenate--cysteine ligase|uniref:bifunctional phosphopantothenoylcysteine decarboxylase/phosphopantothenate--cysteine ligase CoaBC n=1 Tax=Croceibacter atlanticus TaxID=313588 RepID=UPI001C5FD528|nr:bifunctional phosphopantothenoylcysteine decarboxylase/phosphopantothenate--cysteine ligase CoaBC [Croceibacter atlanticus]MBW4968890.1 bifunctional phosphopantothenoylcysteine decarboxylase/phosphopantothenate--cysteine ligase CoaBC [Croceibacter atlanticus]|tara:strand:- start:4712 stop:5923 length:1212 start_codon:yes stop_codon:yes gene_type:complete